MTALSTMPARQQSSLPNSTPPSAQPPIRTPVSILGPRGRSTQDDDYDGLDSPTNKKKRVAFDMNLNMAIDIGSKSVDQARREVKKALGDLARGNNAAYDELKELFGNDRKRYLRPLVGEEEDSLRPEELLVYVVAMTNCAPLLGKASSSLVKTMLRCAWLGRDDVFVSAYIQFLAALSSAHGPCLGQALSMLVEKFRLVKSGDWTVPDFPSVSRNAMRERLHLGLQYLLRIFPAAKPMLRNLLVSNYPYQDDPKSLHFAYIENLFRLQRYAPDMERDITELLTSQMVSLDVSMQLDFDNADDEITQSVLQHLEARPAFETVDDEMSDDSDLDSIHSDDSELDEDELQIITTKSNIRKLDITMNAMFKFYSPRFANPESAEARSTFDKLCTDFINIVLPTTRTRHSQYLLFHFAQMSPELTDRFLGTLFKISGDATTPLIVRCAAIAYIASYVARGARISAEEVQQVVQTMCYEMDRYRANHEALCNGPDLKRYSIYYEWAQGLMFVFCYRWRDLVASVPASVDPDVPASFLDKELQWMDGFQVVARRIVRSKFNPLKVCAPNIVEQYAKMARHLRLDYIYPILNANRSLHLSQVMPAAYHTGGALRESGYGADGPKWTHLEVNDQFDPYQLPDTQHWIEGDYITWQDIPGLNDPEAGQDVDHDDDSSVVEVSDEEDEEDDEFGNNEGMNDARHPRNGPTGAITSLAR